MFIECSEAQKAFRRTESSLWWAGEVPEPRCQGFLLEGGAANNDEKAGQCARAADWYGTSMMVYLGAKEEEGTLIMHAWFHVIMIAQSPATMIEILSKNIVTTR